MTAPADFDRALDAALPVTPDELERELALLAAIAQDKRRIADACAGRKTDTLWVAHAEYGRGERRG